MVSGERVGPQTRSCDYRCRILNLFDIKPLGVFRGTCVAAIPVSVVVHTCLGVLVRFAVVGHGGGQQAAVTLVSAFGLSSPHSFFLSQHRIVRALEVKSVSIGGETPDGRKTKVGAL